jgi:hypothetical protein
MATLDDQVLQQHSPGGDFHDAVVLGRVGRFVEVGLVDDGQRWDTLDRHGTVDVQVEVPVIIEGLVGQHGIGGIQVEDACLQQDGVLREPAAVVEVVVGLDDGIAQGQDQMVRGKARVVVQRGDRRQNGQQVAVFQTFQAEHGGLRRGRAAWTAAAPPRRRSAGFPKTRQTHFRTPWKECQKAYLLSRECIDGRP